MGIMNCFSQEFFKSDEFWPSTQRAVVVCLIAWAWFGQVTPAMSPGLNKMVIFGFPCGFYMCAQGILIAFVAINFGYAFWKDRIDNRAGYTEPVEDDEADSGAFHKNLGKVYGIYTGGFATFVLFLTLLNEAFGVKDEIIGYLFVIFTILVYALIGIMSHTKETKDYFVAGHNVPAVFNGMATAADWMSGASFVGMAGKVYAAGFQGLSFVVGWTGGFCLVAILIAPYLRKFGCYTVPDFFADRYVGETVLFGKRINLGNVCRVQAIIVLIFASFTYLTAQAYSIGIIMSRFLGLNFTASCFIGLAGILFCSLLGGMRAVTWTQVAQYIVLIVAYLIPCIWMSVKTLKSPLPWFSYGRTLQAIAKQEVVVEELYSVEGLIPHYLDVGNQFDFWSLSVCLMIGTASLPHVLMRYFTTPSVREARRSVAWSLLFILFLYATTPAYASFTKLEVLTNVIGSTLSKLPDWIYIYGKIDLVTVCGESAKDAAGVLAACTAKYSTQNVTGDSFLMYEDININNDVVVLAAPEISSQPYIVAGLLSAGGLAAALSTADGLLLAIANSLSHDLYFHMFDQSATPERRMLVSRTLLVVIAVMAAGAASTKPADILAMVAWAFSMAASGNFPALLLGIWWKRTNAQGAVAGIFVGFFTTLLYVFGTRYGDMEQWFKSESYPNGLPSITIAIVTMPLGLIVMIVVTLMTPPPSPEVQELVERVRHFDEVTLKNEGESDKDGGGVESAVENGHVVENGTHAVVKKEKTVKNAKNRNNKRGYVIMLMCEQNNTKDLLRIDDPDMTIWDAIHLSDHPTIFSSGDPNLTKMELILTNHLKQPYYMSERNMQAFSVADMIAFLEIKGHSFHAYLSFINENAPDTPSQKTNTTTDESDVELFAN